MMITLTLTAAFSVLGLVVLLRGGQRLNRWELGPAVEEFDIVGTALIFGTLLMLLFSFNTGLASAVALDGKSPSNVPWSQAQDSHRALDNAAHVWVNDHAYGNVYGDPITHGQTDWRLPAIELQTTRQRSYGEGLDKPRGEMLSLAENPEIEPGYVLLLSHNLEDGRIVQRYTAEDVPLSEFNRELDQRHRIYTGGLSAVYYAPDQTNEEGE